MSVHWRGVSRGEKNATEVRKAESVETEGQGSGRVRDPTVFFGPEQEGVARGAVTHLCERQHLQLIHRIFLKTPKQHRCTPLSVCHLSDRCCVRVLLVVHHLRRRANVSINSRNASVHTDGRECSFIYIIVFIFSDSGRHRSATSSLYYR